MCTSKTYTKDSCIYTRVVIKYSRRVSNLETHVNDKCFIALNTWFKLKFFCDFFEI